MVSANVAGARARLIVPLVCPTCRKLTPVHHEVGICPLARTLPRAA